MRFRLFELLVLLLNYSRILHLELLSLRFSFWWWIHIWHIEYLKHRIEIQMIKIKAFQDDLGDDEINILFFQFYFLKEGNKVLLCNSSFAIPFGIQG